MDRYMIYATNLEKYVRVKFTPAIKKKERTAFISQPYWIEVDWSWGKLKLMLIEVEVNRSWDWLKLRLIEVEVDCSWGWLKSSLIGVQVIEVEVDWG